MALQTRPTIVIVGAGFAGLQTAISLGNTPADVYLIDRNAYHTFVPLLYQVATATLLPEQIAFPVRSLCRRHRNLQFIQANVESIDLDHHRVHTSRLTLNYDYLVMATGSQSTYHRVPGAADYAKPLRTLQDAIALRNHILRCIEQSRWEKEPLRKQQLLTFAIIGGGATGVELAGALAEMIQGALTADYPELDLALVRIFLVQSSAQLLPEFSPRLGRYTARALTRQKVDVLLETRAKQVTASQVELCNGTVLDTSTVIWAVGVQSQIPDSLQTWPLTKKQKLQSQSTLQLQQHQEVYAIGDVAEVHSRGHPLSGVAPEALQQGVATAKNLQRQLKGRSPKPFHYVDKGRLAIIGGYAGVGKIGPFPLKGFVPWALWLGVHLVYLPGYLSRIQVLLTWLNAYIWGDRTVRQRLGDRN